MNKEFKIELNSKQLEFLVKCIDISQSSQSIVPDKSEVELIRELSELHEEIQNERLGENFKYD